MAIRSNLIESKRSISARLVILTTAYGEEVAMSTVGGQHDWAFIRKPYRITELAKMLRDVLSA